MTEHPHVLLATLGGQPQIVTFTLDLLLARGFPINEVIVIHPEIIQPRLQHSVTCLTDEFTGNYYKTQHHPIAFRPHVLEMDGMPIDDIVDDLHADGTLNTIHQLIGDYKWCDYRIHLSVSGGRRLMALLAISVAFLNFDRHDHIWHLYTPESIKEQVSEGRLMHVLPDAGTRLIQGPFLSLGAYTYSQPRSFRTAQEEQRSQMEAQERARCTSVEKETTLAQRKVLHAFSQGIRPQQVASQLHIEPATVHSHKRVLLQLCRKAWNIDDHERLDYHFLHTKFANYFENDEVNYIFSGKERHHQKL